MDSTHLSRDEFEAVVTGLLAQAGGNESRREPRVTLNGTAGLVTEVGAAPIPVKLRDASRGGVSLEYNEALGDGQRLVLQLPRAGGVPLSVPCVVRHCRVLGPGSYAVGVQFAA